MEHARFLVGGHIDPGPVQMIDKLPDRVAEHLVATEDDERRRPARDVLVQSRYGAADRVATME